MHKVCVYVFSLINSVLLDAVYDLMVISISFLQTEALDFSEVTLNIAPFILNILSSF